MATVIALAAIGAPSVDVAEASASPSREEILEQAASLTRAREWAAVVELLEPAHRADPDSPEVALLLAIAYYRQDRVDAAEPLFRDLSRHHDDEIADTARLFLGLLARDRGDERRARELFRDVASSATTLSDSAQVLLRPAAGRRIAAAASVRTGADSNVPLLSSQTVGPGASPADLSLLVTGAAVAWPLRDTDLRLLSAGAYRKQARLTEFDYGAGRAGAHYERKGQLVDVSLTYSFEVSALGQALLSAGHAADVRARIPGRRFAELDYALRIRTFQHEAYDGYSGDWHRASAWFGARLRGGEAAIAAIVEGERTRDPELGGWGAGASARLSMDRNRLRIRAYGELLPRQLGARRDVRAEAYTSLSYAFAEHVAWLFGVSALANQSTAPEFQHVKLAAFAGLELRL